MASSNTSTSTPPTSTPPTPASSPAERLTDAGGSGSTRTERIRRSGPETWSFRVPAVGTLQLSTAELIYVGGIVGLAAFGALDWPIGLVIAGGHLLAADRSSRTVRDLGDAMTEAG